MANDINNNAAGTTGVSRIGTITVATGGSKLNSYQTLDPGQPDVLDTNIADVAAKFDARFDDPRYYGGDLVT